MTDRTMSLLSRNRARLAYENLRRHVVLGLLISAILTFFGAFQYYLVIDASQRLWGAVAIAGLASFVVTLLLPSLWTWPEYMLRTVGGFIGHAIFNALLVLAYVGLVLPIGLVLRRQAAKAGIKVWAASGPSAPALWQPKLVLTESRMGQKRGRNLIAQLLRTIEFFIRGGHYVLLPVIAILIALGLALFFVKTSALAPFIYTLF